jgi:hypothetical protein
MGDTYAIMALHRKRAHLAGEIEAAERTIVGLRKTLATLDATIRLFEPTSNPELIPAIRPTRRGLFFRHGEQMRLCVSALREAQGPLSARQVAVYAMQAKGLPLDNGPILASITVQLRVALHRLKAKGIVQEIISRPETWWELDGAGPEGRHATRSGAAEADPDADGADAGQVGQARDRGQGRAREGDADGSFD